MDRLYAALPAHVAVVDVDDTVTVRRVTPPVPDASLTCVAASPVDPDVVCCGTADNGLVRSLDAGETWTAVDGIDHDRVTSLTCAVGGVGARNGADRTVDGRGGRESGVVWWAGTEPSAVYRSPDGAVWSACGGLTDLPSASSWAFPPRPHTHHVRWLEVDPHAPAHLFVAVEAGALVQTDDGGETWRDRVPGSRRDTHSMATHPDAPGRAYCAAGDGYAETDDGGETWHYPQEGLDHRYCWSVAADPDDPEHRLLSAARGAARAHRAASADTAVYRRQGDRPWHRVTGLPTGVGVTRYVFATGDDGFYALSNAGLFRSRDGAEWDRLPLSVADDATVAGAAVSTAR